MDASRYRTALYLGLGIVLAAILFYNNHAGLIARQNQTCQSVNEVKAALVAYIDQQLDRAAKSLPTIEYYQHHPVELGRALANLNDQREATHEAFAPTSC